MNDVLLNKKVSVERCIRQIKSYYLMPTEVSFEQDYLKQDAIAINLQRISELAVDMAAYLIKKKKWGLPKDSRDHFRTLQQKQVIPESLSIKLQKMVGFRNVLVHEYQDLDITLMQDVIENRLNDLIEYTNLIIEFAQAENL